MAYSRTSRYARKPARTYRRKPRYIRKPRTYVRKTRTYTRKPRKSMSRRNILNITSRKKKDTMQPVTYNSTSGAPTNTATYGAAAPVQGNRINMFYWCPTARDLSLLNGGAGSTAQEAMRTARRTYMRLLSEKIEIQTNSAQPWTWRRIVFCGKGPDFHPNVVEQAPPAQRLPFIESSQGYGRLLQQFDTAGGLGNTQAVIFERLFRGQINIDWTDPMLAPCDPSRVVVLYDKRTVIRSGNNVGVIKQTRRTHYFNKTLLYDDDETGEVMNTNFWSVENRQGMGDVYVIDLFQAGTNSTASDLLLFQPEATLYWHER